MHTAPCLHVPGAQTVQSLNPSTPRVYNLTTAAHSTDRKHRSVDIFDQQIQQPSLLHHINPQHTLTTMQLSLPLLLLTLSSTILAIPKLPFSNPLKNDPKLIGTTLYHGKGFTGGYIYSTVQTNKQGWESAEGCSKSHCLRHSPQRAAVF